jgi:hypothetical protein
VRGPIMEHFEAMGGRDWLTVRKGDAGLVEFVTEMSSHRFALCPPGNGIDTYRMWEALYSRTIPVVLRNPALRDFEDLPIVFVDNFRQVTFDFLECAYRRVTSAEWNWEKMFAPWWQKILTEARATLLAGGARLSLGKFYRRLLSAGWATATRRLAASRKPGRIAGRPSA